MTFTWLNGRQLQSAAVGGKALSFAYNADGIRMKKTVDGVTTRYALNDTRVIAQETVMDAPIYYGRALQHDLRRHDGVLSRQPHC